MKSYQRFLWWFFVVVVVGVLLQMSVYLFISLSSFLLWHSGKIDWFQQSCFQSSSLGWALNEHLSDKSQLLVLQIMFCLICSKANLACRKQSHQMCISQLPSGKLSVILSSQMSAFGNIPFENSDQGSPKKCHLLSHCCLLIDLMYRSLTVANEVGLEWHIDLSICVECVEASHSLHSSIIPF